MSYVLGLDIGSNSVGSARIDTNNQSIKFGISVFPAGVEESETKRGNPKNQSRRSQRQQERSIKRRAELKRRLRQYLSQKGWIPAEKEQLQKWESLNPWLLRRDAVHEELKTDEKFTAEEKFGRVLLHLAQRRGAWWFDEEAEELEGNENKKKKKAEETPGTVEYTKKVMKEKKAETFGELMAIEYEGRKIKTANKKTRGERIKNKDNALGEKVSEYVADRHMILAEFNRIWDIQKGFKESALAKQLTDDCKKEIYNKEKTDTWRCQGVLFSQRKAYWNVGTLGRCDLEPTDMKCPKADMYAQEFLVLTSINNIRITPPMEASRKLDEDERKEVISLVRTQKTASESTIRKALGIDKGVNKTLYTLNTDGDKFTVNGDLFHSQIVCGVFSEEKWSTFQDKQKDSVNKAILKFDPNDEEDEKRLRSGCKKWWGLNDEQAEKFISVWKKMPKKDRRVNLSRKAIKNLLPYLRDGYSVTEARDMFAEDASNGADDLTRKRYSIKDVVVNKRIKQFLGKHPDLLPPVSEGISNPVVRKSIHEVRKHLIEHIRQAGIPERVVIELAREARQTARDIAKRIQKNKAIEDLKKDIIKKHNLDAYNVTSTHRKQAILRVRLCRQQRYVCAYSGLNEEKDKYACAYSGESITEAQAADGSGLEIDHIVPRSKGGKNVMSNLVLCYKPANEGKKDRTPIDWLSEEDFGQLEKRFKHLHKDKSDKTAINKDTVDMTDNEKWKNLHRRTPKEGFTDEQLSSAAYAAKQTADWINKVLYGDRNRSKRYVFASNGNYTDLLRRDWGLFFDSNGNRSEKGGKNRGDHRHHAVDAAIIAMSPQNFPKIKQAFVGFEKQKEKYKKEKIDIEPRRETIEQPWEGFSEKLAEEYKKIKIAHRSYNRKITGHLHKASLYGPAIIYERHAKDNKKKGIKKGDIKLDNNGKPVLREGMYIKSIPVIGIKQSHLRMPDGWDNLKEKYKIATQNDKKKIRKKMLSLIDVPPARSGIIRDIELRDKIRDWLKEHSFKDMASAKAIIKEKGLVINGTPVRKVRLLWKLNEVKEIKRKGFDYKNSPAHKIRKSLRVYQTQNNHHIEIREKISKKGEKKWSGDVVTNFNAAIRARKEKKAIVDKNENKNGEFVMSLSKGEMVHMKHPETNEPDYFVVFKIDSSNTIHFTPHTDANPAKEKYGRKRQDISIKPDRTKYNDGLKQLITYDKNEIPEKVKISPLGNVKILVKD